MSYLSLWKKKHKRDFKKAYGGGFLGYDHIYNFGHVSQFVATIDTSNLELNTPKDNEQLILDSINKDLENLERLESKLKDYVYEIPETETWSILPVVRFESSAEQYTSFTLSDSIKFTKLINTNLLADIILLDLKKIIAGYYLRDADLELIIMGRPWLSVDEFDLDRFLDRQDLDNHFNRVIEKKLASHFKTLEAIDSSQKISELKNYPYKNIFMDSYGEPLYDKSKILIGYQIDGNKCASIKTYYNDNNLLCNKVSIREFDKVNLEFKSFTLKSWVDIKMESGFIREYDKNKYYYNDNNKLINVETKYKYSTFPLYLSNLGMGYHQVYAGGWSTKDQTQLFYKTTRETSDQLVNRIF